METSDEPSAAARIVWLTPDEGGRWIVPPGPRYIAPAHFDVPDEKWPEEAWSLVATKESDPSDNEWVARVTFLVPEAPHEWLRSGNRFDYHEGERVVARG